MEANFGAKSGQVHQIRGKTLEVLSPQDAEVGKSPHSGVISEIQRVKFGNCHSYFLGQPLRPPNMEVPPGYTLKVAVSTLSAKAKLFNIFIFNSNGNVAQDQDDGDDDMDDDDDKMPSQGQIVDLPAIHSQMTDAEIKKVFK